jgi:D-sedoheptulose 7-phosphate isomerase
MMDQKYLYKKFSQKIKKNILNLKKFDEIIFNKIYKISDIIINNSKKKIPTLICGNGGSASDSLHLSGELVCTFMKKKRKALNVIPLVSNQSVITAWGNDFSFDDIFSRQVLAHGTNDALIIGLTTSGNSKNIVNAFKVAKKLKMKTACLTGFKGGKVNKFSDILVNVPGEETAEIQELHIILYHMICEIIDNKLDEK